MAARKQLVDMMFKRFDADNNGQIDASELSQVRKQKMSFHPLSEHLHKENNAHFTESITCTQVQCNLTLTEANTDLIRVLY